MSTYLITGGAGFIGSHLARKLLSEGHTVKIIDNLVTGNIDNLSEIRDEVEFFEKDIRDLDAIQAATKGVDYVLHQAALASVPRSIDNPLASNESNITGTLNVLLAARDNNVQRVIYAASSSAYGDQDVEVKIETLKESPLSPYATAKLASEFYCKNFYEVYGLETVCLRYFNVFGERQDPLSPYAAVIAKFVFDMIDGKSPNINGDGAHSRDFTYVANNVNANLLACTADKAACGESINIACGKSVDLNELVAAINNILGTSIKATHKEERTGDIKHSLAGIDKAKELLGYEPTVSFEDGLQKYIDWAKTQV